MKKVLMLSVVVVLITLLSGCMRTLHPLFTEKDLEFDGRLVGSWHTDPDDNEYIQFEQGSAASFSKLPESLQRLAGKAYLLRMFDGSGEASYVFYAFLCRIGGQLYLDYYPAENKHQQYYDKFYLAHEVKMHSFFHVQFTSDGGMKLDEFSQDFLDELIKKNKIRIQHEVRFDGTYVITAPTEELQQYVLKYSDVPEAYSNENSDTYYKIK